MAWNVGNATSPASVRTRGRWIATFRPPRTTSLRVVPAQLAGRAGSWAYRGPQMAVRSSSSMVVKAVRPDRKANSNSSVFVSTQIDQRQTTQRRFRVGNGRGYARLLHGGSFSVRLLGLRLSHHSFYTSSEEPPLSNFNSYWDMPRREGQIVSLDRLLCIEVKGETSRATPNRTCKRGCANVAHERPSALHRAMLC
jgi:hypothetical protein